VLIAANPQIETECLFGRAGGKMPWQTYEFLGHDQSLEVFSESIVALLIAQ
jgi:hypothetical protein